MVFDNDLTPATPLRKVIAQHLPLGLVVLGLIAAGVAMHTAIKGILLIAIAHVVLGLVVLGIKRHRSRSS